MRETKRTDRTRAKKQRLISAAKFLRANFSKFSRRLIKSKIACFGILSPIKRGGALFAPPPNYLVSCPHLQLPAHNVFEFKKTFFLRLSRNFGNVCHSTFRIFSVPIVGSPIFTGKHLFSCGDQCEITSNHIALAKRCQKSIRPFNLRGRRQSSSSVF